MQNVRVGQFVQYSDNTHGAVMGIITLVEPDSDVINLCCFAPDGTTFPATNLSYSDAAEIGAWSWPPSPPFLPPMAP